VHFNVILNHSSARKISWVFYVLCTHPRKESRLSYSAQNSCTWTDKYTQNNVVVNSQFCLKWK